MKEEDIRKRDVFDKYLEMGQNDVKAFFDFKSFVEIKCPACGKGSFVMEFNKNGFTYVSCKYCLTLFVNPRPPFKVLSIFYSDSKSTSFFIHNFFKPVAENRRKNIFRPRAEYVSRILDRNKKYVVGDIGAGFGLFLEELKDIMPDNRYIAIEPSLEMSGICREKKLEVECVCLEDSKFNVGTFDLLASFELAEHLFDPAPFFKKVYSLLKPGGYLFLTTLNSKGFDILLLWDRSKSITPPYHLNFFNILSIEVLLKKIGFKIEQILTPGQLDWDIVEGMIKKEGVDLGRFWNLLANEPDGKIKKQLQGWISENKLSSHMSILAKK